MCLKKVRSGFSLLAVAAALGFATMSFFAVRSYSPKNGGTLAPAVREETRKRTRLSAVSQVAIALAALASVYLLINRGPAGGGVTQTYVVQPSLWAALALVILLLSRLGQYRLSFSKALVPLALLAGAFHLSVLISGGLLVGFGHSPYSHSVRVLIQNLTWVFSSLVALELTRAYLLSALGRRRTVLMLAATALLFTFVSVSLARITSLDTGAKATDFLGEMGFPLLAQNLLASYLALLGGPLPAIAYRGMLEAYEWLSPILPNLPWALTAFLGTVAPVIGFLAVRSVCEGAGAAETEGTPQPERKAAIGWVTVGIVAVGLTWFAIGLFPIYPVVTAGHSMDPTLHEGDLVIMREVSADGVDVGDIIQYEGEHKHVLHRVVEATGSGRNREFVTKGDGNNVADPQPVRAEAVRGEVLFYMPKLGYVGIGIKEVIGKASGMLSVVGLD